MRGSIMPEPLVMPPTRNVPAARSSTSTAADFGNGSVVMMAVGGVGGRRRRAAPPPPCGMPPRSAAIFRFTPMTPVEATSTSSAAQPTAAAVSAAISRASAMPCGPVQALAQPLLATMARARPPVAARCAFDTSTGAAWAWFGREHRRPPWPACRTTSSARSGLPLALMPQCRPAARKPRGAVTPPAMSVIV